MLNQLKLVGHRNIVALHRVQRTPEHLVLFLDFCKKGTLYDFWELRYPTGLGENEARKLFRQLILAVAYCHTQAICIRDIKPDNILITREEPDIEIKICDFGYSKARKDSLPRTRAGTPYYVAPDVVEAYSKSLPYDGMPADIWSCGVTLYLLIFCSFPFQKAIPTRKDVTELRFPRAVSAELKDLLSGMLNPEPTSRYTVQQVMTSVWVQKGLDDRSLQEFMSYNEKCSLSFRQEHMRLVSEMTERVNDQLSDLQDNVFCFHDFSQYNHRLQNALSLFRKLEWYE